MNTMQAHDYNESKTINTVLERGRFILEQKKRKGTISSKLTVLVLLFLMLFACFGCGNVARYVPEEASELAAQCKRDGFTVSITQDFFNQQTRVSCDKTFANFPYQEAK
jgi:hypothetical protein